jgi:hypothetical protein
MTTALLALRGIFSSTCSSNSEQKDPNICRMISTSDIVHSLREDSFRTNSGYEIVMKYDLQLDPSMMNKVNPWNVGKDIYGKSAYAYTRWDGPLGM